MQVQILIEGNHISVSGRLDGAGAAELAKSIGSEGIFTLDFSEVEDINFAALRTLLRNRQNGKRFSIVNARNAVAEKFEDTGVSIFINVCRKPKPLDRSRYREFGAGYLSKSLNSEDGDSMLKIYGANVAKRLVAQEKAVARSVMIFGIPTPLVGTIYEDGAETALDFECIPNKRSLSRVISEEPERMEEITRHFAQMCKHLHSTQCDTSIFQDRKTYYRQMINDGTEITAEEKQKALVFLDSIPDATTCLHGDMQLSNVITNGEDYLWIDLGDFGYGNPMLDMGMWYFLSNLNPERLCQHIFHLSKQQMGQIWDIFAEEYFGADTEEKKERTVAQVEPFAALHMLYLGSTYGFEPGMMDFIRAKLFKQI